MQRRRRPSRVYTAMTDFFPCRRNRVTVADSRSPASSLRDNTFRCRCSHSKIGRNAPDSGSRTLVSPVTHFPIPGSPPTRTRDPGTRPPPRTRSSSPIPVLTRGSLASGTSVMGRGTAEEADPERTLLARGDSKTSSTNVFHSPQDGHFPIHLGELCPQFWQTYWTLALTRLSSLANAVRHYMRPQTFQLILMPAVYP